jgi:hypothetical protein
MRRALRRFERERAHLQRELDESRELYASLATTAMGGAERGRTHMTYLQELWLGHGVPNVPEAQESESTDESDSEDSMEREEVDGEDDQDHMHVKPPSRGKLIRERAESQEDKLASIRRIHGQILLATKRKHADAISGDDAIAVELLAILKKERVGGEEAEALGEDEEETEGGLVRSSKKRLSVRRLRRREQPGEGEGGG